MPPDNLEPRVTALETQVQKLSERVRASEQDAAAARILAGAADRDVTEFRGELRDFRQAAAASFNALRADLTDLRKYADARFDRIDGRFDNMDSRFDNVDSRFSQVDNGFIEIRGKLDATAAGQHRIVELLERLTPDQG
ncbi:MAG TPA: hypothetical protein VFQ37_00645 [Mycobacterium sp.]|nr:hypothetical protein [Mycobacterium sp.]